MNNRILVFIYIISLQLFDIMTTYLSLMRGGLELNPLFYFLGFESFALIKLLAGLFIYVIVSSVKSAPTRLSVLSAYTVIMLYAIINNVITALL